MEIRIPTVPPSGASPVTGRTAARLLGVFFLFASSLLAAPIPARAQDAALLAKAKAGDEASQLQLGGFYAGLNTEDGYTQAALWYRKAADQGDPKAQFALGSLYCWHQGVPLDFSTAYFWLDLAVTAGVPDDNHMRSYAWSHLSADQVAAAQQKVKAWQHTHKEKSAS